MNEKISRDTILGGGLELDPGEKVIAEFGPDRATYWRGHIMMAGIGGLVALVVLLLMGQAAPWVGPIGAFAALGIRGWYLASETLALRWHLSNRRLIIPGGRAFGLGEIVQAKPFFGNVQIVTRAGDKHLMKYMADAPAVIAAIEAAARKR
jgi:hypothetical protein